MPKVKVESLTIEGFLPYGYFSRLTDPVGETIGCPPVEFFRDMLQLDLGLETKASVSVCHLQKRPDVVSGIEYHNSCGELVLPLDNDILICVAPASAGDAIPYDKIRIFYVPKATCVVLRPGVWHYAPFVAQGEYANVLIVLPERIYAKDCRIFELQAHERVTIER